MTQDNNYTANTEGTYYQPASTPDRAYSNAPAGYGIPNYNPAFNYTPISAWGYAGYSLLFMIPLAGFICLLVFALGGTNNIHLRNYARSYFCLFLIVLVLGIFFMGLGLS